MGFYNSCLTPRKAIFCEMSRAKTFFLGRVPSHAFGPSPVSPVTRQLVAWSVARSIGRSVAFRASDRLSDQASDRMSNRSSKPPARTQSLGLPRLPRVPSHVAVPSDFCRCYQRFPPIAFPFLTFPFPSLSSPTLPSLPFSLPSFPSPFLPSFLPSFLRSVLCPPSTASPLLPKVGSAEPRSVNNFDECFQKSIPRVLSQRSL